MTHIPIRNALDKKTQSLKFKHILIVTYGRSGSTLLQGILNTIDGVVLRGENDNVFFDFYKAYNKLVDLKKQRSKAVEPNNAWYGICLVDEKELLARFHELAKTILLADKCDEAATTTYGFKEIRYSLAGDDFGNYLDFLSQLFPNVAFIFNTRDLQDVASSGWWKDGDRTSVIGELEALEARFSAYAGERTNCFSIRYEDVLAKGEQLRKLFNFLGAEYQPEVIEATLNTPHSYNPEQGYMKKMLQR